MNLYAQTPRNDESFPMKTSDRISLSGLLVQRQNRREPWQYLVGTEHQKLPMVSEAKRRVYLRGFDSSIVGESCQKILAKLTRVMSTWSRSKNYISCRRWVISRLARFTIGRFCKCEELWRTVQLRPMLTLISKRCSVPVSLLKEMAGQNYKLKIWLKRTLIPRFSLSPFRMLLTGLSV